MRIRLGGVHPPGIHPQHPEFLVDLPPVHVARGLGIRIVERRGVALAYPVEHAFFDVLAIHEAGGVEFLVVGGRRVELRPHRDHEAHVLGVHLVDHALWIREAPGIELV